VGSSISRFPAWVSHRLSAVGERYDIEPLVYHPGVMLRYDWLARQSAPGFAARLLATFGNVRFLDVGAGTGRFAQAVVRQGGVARACEHSRWGRSFAAARRFHIELFDLTRNPAGPAPKDYDVAFCLEVAEHLSPELGDQLVAYLGEFPTVLFTAAHPGQGGTGHINLQPKPYWAERFARHGLRRCSEREATFHAAPGDLYGDWLLQNLTIFTRTTAA
jgi:hypothetical protein